MKISNKIIALLLILCLAFSLAACGNQAPGNYGQSMGGQEQNDGETGDGQNGGEASGPVTVTDQAGREVTIEGPVEKIVSGYYISSSACIALGLTEKMAGIEAKAASRPIYKLAAPGLMDLPNVGTAKEFDLEGCIALEPDLVILPLKLKDSAETMTKMGIPTILVNPESHELLVEAIELIARAAGADAAADKLIAYYNTEMAEIDQLTGELSEDARPLVYMSGNSSYLTTSPRDMYQSSLISAAGGKNAAGEIEGASWTEVSYEQLLAMDPQVIVIPAEAAYEKEDILKDPQLTGLAAVKAGAVYKMPDAFEAWDSPVPSGILGSKWLLSVLHEDLYPFSDFQADVKAFYGEFYGAEIDEALVTK
ncbi:MAG: ABC transporter substrate-binding protein [Peptococcaceae bacterium]|nr:ABC transporter substrate-binding protein [Peptococcaceae bacterium]